MRKFNRPTDQRMSVMRSLATNLLWYGKIETTLAKAKDLRTYAEKIITKAINTYEDVVKVNKTVVDAKGAKSTKEVVNDGAKKLAARRDIMSKLYDIQEQRAEKESKADFISKMNIALKETYETDYWLRLLFATQYLSQEAFDSIVSDCTELKKLLVSIVKTAKE